MEWNRKIFEIAWRLSILALPWQTRFFWDAQIVGWPWEQGRVSIYLSWIPMLVAILFGFFQAKKDLPLKFRQNLFWLIAALAACSVLALPSPNAAAVQWWVQIMLLIVFFITLLRLEVSIKKFAFWFAISLIPHALLAVWQYVSQSVVGSSWLGMSSQNPATPGVSVVQTATGRFLRAYGGFPHPNILGGWMAVGLLTIVFLSLTRVGERSQAYAWGIEGLFTLALFFSFSRSAWMAAAIGILVFGALSFMRNRESRNKNLILSLFIPIAIFSVFAFINRDLVLTRADQASRLEQKSIVTRVQGLKDGLDVFKSKWLFGTGPNTELPVLVRLENIQTSSAPLEPPHMVWLMILVNFGIAGTIAILGFFIFLFLKLIKRWQSLDPTNRVLIPTLTVCYLILGSLDHYPWSFWSGQVLTLYVIILLYEVE
ncbi:MAG: O-antigen ligase family protein [Patescibacteria group bacterium]|nr:O-antigen ligase family protein [Patescibacteria group bacterium]